jgi:hypothetical protein
MLAVKLEHILLVLTGVVIPVAVALVAHVLQKRHERQRTLEERRFDVYMKLMGLNALYFWYATKWSPTEPVPQELRTKLQGMAFELADRLRGIDDDAHVDEALDVLFRIDYTQTADARAAKLRALIDRMGNTVNPRYARKMSEISAANVKATAANLASSAPGAPWPWM